MTYEQVQHLSCLQADLTEFLAVAIVHFLLAYEIATIFPLLFDMFELVDSADQVCAISLAHQLCHNDDLQKHGPPAC